MPGKRTKNDTWTENDLLKAIQGEPKDKKQHSSRDKSSTRERDHSHHRGDKEKNDKIKRKERSHSKHHGDDDVEKRSRDSKGSTHRSKDGESRKDRESKKEKDSSKGIDESNKRTREKKGRDDPSYEPSSHKEDRKGKDDKRNREENKTKEEKRKKEEKRRRKEEKKSKEELHSKDRRETNNEERKHPEKENTSRESSGKDKQKVRKEKRIEQEADTKERERSARKKEKKVEEREKKMMRVISQESLKENHSKKQKEENVVEVTDEYNYDDDEFDDYDDDFEDDEDEEEKEKIYDDSSKNSDESENEDVNLTESIIPQKSMFRLSAAEEQGMNEVLKAISAENDKIYSSSSNNKNLKVSAESEKISKVDANEPSRRPQQKSFGKINFMAASQKQINEKVAKRNKQRGEELLKLIQLDVRSVDLFDMPPMTEYELYMKRFGQSDCKQMFTQTNDDNNSQEVQTEEIAVETRWCQHSHDLKACAVSHDGDLKSESSLSINSFVSLNTRRLNTFLPKATKVCCSLLEELEAGIEQPQRQYVDARTSFSDGYVTLTASNFLVLGRTFSAVSYSLDETNMLLTAYGASNVIEGANKLSKGLICVWNTNEPTKPHKLLVCESVPSSCCFSSGSPSTVFAGMEDGVIAVWDLNEPDSFHDLYADKAQLIFRTATFTTAGTNGHHNCPIVHVTPLTSSKRNSSVNHQSRDMSFQLASLDQSGLVNIWIVVEVHHNADELTHVHDDLGLSPRGTIKIIKSDTVVPPMHPSSSILDSLFLTTCFQINVNHFYIGTEQGDVLHSLRFGNRPSPKSFIQSKDSTNQVTAVDVSPWQLPIMLVSYANGSISLFHLQRESPLITWSLFSNGRRIIDVRWSRSLPNVFYAIDENSMFFAWDLLESDIAPTFEQKILRKDKRAIGFTFANDYSSMGQGTPGRSAELALIYGDGSVEVHRITKKLSLMRGDENDSMYDYVENLT